MKTILLYILFLTSVNFLKSEGWQSNIKDSSNFYSIKQAFINYLEEKNKDRSLDIFDKEDDETQFRRWEYMLEPRVYPTGKFPKPNILLTEWNKFQSESFTQFDTLFKGNWKSLESPDGFPENGYSGRLNCIAFHPVDTNIMFVGSPAGGLWKTTNGGISWTPKTDYLPSLGVSEIVFDYENPDIIYMATGDRDGAYFISNPYSYGILKSTNGGESWDTTGLNHLFSEQMTIKRLVIHPKNPNILMAAITGVNGNLRGIWRTTDGGKSWKNVSGGAKYDLEFKPDNPDIVYTSGYKYLARSTDGGSTWSNINSAVLPVSEVSYAKIAVTPANPDVVYVQYLNPNTGSTFGIFKSWDAGLTWTKINSFEITTQGGYDWVFTLSPIDTNIVLSGGQYLFGSTNGGTSFRQIAHGHVDDHDLVYHPVTKALFNCNDGGLYKSYNNGSNWINLNRGLHTFQFYRLGSSSLNENLILTGAQDNGTQRHSLFSWYLFGSLADGMECIVDYTDTNIYYSSYQYGWLNRFGLDMPLFNKPPYSGSSKYYAWVTPYLMHPNKPQTLFIGGKDILKTTNRGNSWVYISNQLTSKDNVGGGFLRAMAIAESNPDSVLYAASYVVVYKTTDGGNTWLNITSNLPTSAGCFDCSAISSIAVHPENSFIAWVTMSGYNDSNKVYKTTDGGASWFNISLNLPAIPVNNIIHQKNSKEGLYLGTDLGVFYKDSTMDKWIPFMNGLPNVPVQELEFHYASQKIRAATFGRGLWESNLYGYITSVKDAKELERDFIIVPNPASDYIELLENFINFGEILIYSVLGIKVFETEYKEKIDISFLPPGFYFLKSRNKMLKFVKL